MKISADQFGIVENNLKSALALAELGWNVFPLRPGSKAPLIAKSQGGNGAYDGTTDPEQITKWWSKFPTAGIGANLGDDRVAFDIDIQNGGEMFKSFPVTRTHLSGRGNGNCHLIYKFTPGSAASKLIPKTAALGRGNDIKIGRGAYIVMPPTLHADTGQPYSVAETNGRVEHVLTDDEVAAIFAEADQQTPEPGKGMAKSRGSFLMDLLNDPPAEGGRNDWLTKVAGHYAKSYRNQRDLFDLHVEQANMMLTEPLSPFEVAKTAESIWRLESTNHAERDASEETGYLTGSGKQLVVQTQVKIDGDYIPAMQECSNFDIKALGKFTNDDDQISFWVNLHTGGRDITKVIDERVLGDDRALRKWLVSFGAVMNMPMNAMPKMSNGDRLALYLMSQEPPEIHVTDVLGWDLNREKFVTLDGAISANGFETKEQAGIVANPQRASRVPHNYGFEESTEAAKAALAEVMTFQDPTAAAVFGSWWAACFLKPQFHEAASLFPFFAVEASSESGKTNGFFNMMVQLNGNHQGHIVPTRPALRDLASLNRSGIIWADDLNSLEAYEELLRSSTSNGVSVKMDMDNRGTVDANVVSPIFVTGEALGISTQKALLDRVVKISVGSPTARRSLKGDYPQWDDIVALQKRYPKDKGGLTQLTGWLVQEALKVSDQTISLYRDFKRKSHGRRSETLSILRAGSRLLDHLCGQENAFEGRGDYSKAFDIWLDGEMEAATHKGDNVLTTKILPWALRTWDYPTLINAAPEMGRFSGIKTPVMVKYRDNDPDNPEIWFSVTLLADAWARDKGSAVDRRTETEESLKLQANGVTMPKGYNWSIAGTRSKQFMRLLTPELASVVMVRSMD